jgi:hypothetical protein
MATPTKAPSTARRTDTRRTAAPRPPDQQPAAPAGRPRGTRRRYSLPTLLRVQLALCLLLIAGLAALTASGATRTQSTWSSVTRTDAPQVVDASGLYQALTDLDAQTANLLLFGDDPTLRAARATALAQYAADRTDADRDLQRATLDAAGDPSVQQALAAVLDAMGRYQDLAARATALNDQAHSAAGKPMPDALADYRQGLALLRGSLLPAADRLIRADDAAFQRRYDAESGSLGSDLAWGLALGLVVLGALIACQVWLAVRFRRVINPPLAAATALVLSVLVLFTGLCADERAQLKVARHDAFDSVVALLRARAVSYDANADESRYLLDPAHANGYATDFQTASQSLATFPGATLDTYDTALSNALTAYHATGKLAAGGYFGTEFANITFPGERAAAEAAIEAYQSYERDDRTLRGLVATQAIAYDTGNAPGESNATFYAYDKALRKLTAINQSAFTAAARQGTAELSVGLPWTGALTGTALLLVWAGVRPRLKEFR